MNMRFVEASLSSCVVTVSNMPSPLPHHIEGLLSYLQNPDEKANEDLALAYFRKSFGERFTRQKDARRADGYVAGSFVLELKGKASKWLSGLFQGLAYRNQSLDFAQIVVAAQNFLAVWEVNKLPKEIREEIALESGAPSDIGTKYAKIYATEKNRLLKLATWNGGDIFTPLFLSQSDLIVTKLREFEEILKSGQKVRQAITVSNFTTFLKEMRSFFDPEQPIKTVRAFYSMIYAWTDTSVVQISLKSPDQATLGGELISDLVSAKRLQFKDFVENRYIAEASDSYDDFFSRYDQALDAVDKAFRIRNGIYFTDVYLSKFVMWLVKRHVPELGKNYLVIDPACGSGNLVTNWRSPLELRHKVVSEIEPELLFAVERRMRGDQWHNGKFTVVPKVSENRGLNFLDCSATEYLDKIRECLKENGHKPDKPIAFLCNPPYRSDDDQTVSGTTYTVHASITELTGVDAASERYCCFLAQMKRICDAAPSSGLPGDSLLLLFTKSTWLTKRKIFEKIRAEILGSFECISGALFNAAEFFDVKGSWPVAFTVWQYKGSSVRLDRSRTVSFTDLTWLSRQSLREIAWGDQAITENACSAILQDAASQEVQLGLNRLGIKQWSGCAMVDFKRGRRKAEIGAKQAGGLPLNDLRQQNKKAYGETDGRYIGFMDDLTPCRVKSGPNGSPWLNLDARFMAVKKSRCFSGPPTHLGYCASDLEKAKKLFFWYSLGRTFMQRPYPMWVDADEMWAPAISDSGAAEELSELAIAIAYAENECVEAWFPANNPVVGLPLVYASNPLTPLYPDSFWSLYLRDFVGSTATPLARTIVEATNNVFLAWESLFRSRTDIPVDFTRPYFIGRRSLQRGAGLEQIKDYAKETNSSEMISLLGIVHRELTAGKNLFFERICGPDGLRYFSTHLPPQAQQAKKPKRRNRVTGQGELLLPISGNKKEKRDNRTTAIAAAKEKRRKAS